MSTRTGIQWTDCTDNIVVVKGGGHWCRKISEGCVNCYAERLNQNAFFNGNKLLYKGEPPVLELREDMIWGWRRQTKAKRHFVASMTDVFGDWIPQEWVNIFLDGMALATLQTFKVLTKRADVMAEKVLTWLKASGRPVVPGNIWLGVSVENQTRADERIPQLLKIPATVRFLSCEPLLGPVHLLPHPPKFGSLPALMDGIHWVICGGESGPHARPMHPDWARNLRDQATDTGVSFFFKQWGEWAPSTAKPIRGQYTGGDVYQRPNGHLGNQGEWWDGQAAAMDRVGKKTAGRLLDGREWNEFPGEAVLS